MALTFYKYQGTGNDFIMIDNRLQVFDKNNTKRISRLCDRRFGIGADGLILLENHDEVDFRMVYYNADGNESSMCGNGGRCILEFARLLGIIETRATFEAIDGFHDGVIENNKVKLKMNDVSIIEKHPSYLFLDTGSPHHVQLTSAVDELNVTKKGAEIRYNEVYNEKGVNVNFVEKVSTDTFKVRTYERGVENETLSCGTGVTAVALAMHYSKQTNANAVKLLTPGGELTVTFEKEERGYNTIWLIGSATLVFKGETA